MARIILNDSTDLQNVVGKEDLKKITITTLSQLVQQLLSISGPSARNGFILYNNSTLNDGLNTDIMGKAGTLEVFTRDGIHCLSNISYLSPIQRYIKDQLLAFMGRRVDASCGDGTTTSMIFTASFVVEMMKKLKMFEEYSITEIEEAFTDYTKRLLERLDEYKITRESVMKDLEVSENEAAKLLAYLQAYTASSGKIEIAAAIAEIFKRTPKWAWDYAIKQKYPYRETVEQYVRAEADDHQAIFESTILTPELCNMDLGKYYQRDKAHVVIMRTGFLNGSVCAITLHNYLGQCIQKKQADPDYVFTPLVIMIPSAAHSHDENLFRSTLDAARKNGLEVFALAYQRPMGTHNEFMYSIDAISAKADVSAFTELNATKDDVAVLEPFLIECKIRVDHFNTYLDDIIPIRDGVDVEKCLNENVHPGSLYPELYPNYTTWKEHFLKRLDEEANLGDKTNEIDVKDLNLALLTMSVVKNWHISIGGKAHDQNATAHVLDDAAKSALCAVKHGIYFNGPGKFMLHSALCDDSIEETDEESDGLVKIDMHDLCNFTYGLESVLQYVFVRAATDMFMAIFGSRAPYIRYHETLENVCPKGKWEYFDYQRLVEEAYDCFAFNYIDNEKKDGFYKFYLDKNKSKIDAPDFREIFNEYFKDETATGYPRYEAALKSGKVMPPPAQVGNLFEVIFERLREVALRFVLTDNLIAPGTVWDTAIQDKKESK